MCVCVYDDTMRWKLVSEEVGVEGDDVRAPENRVYFEDASTQLFLFHIRRIADVGNDDADADACTSKSQLNDEVASAPYSTTHGVIVVLCNGVCLVNCCFICMRAITVL